MNGPEHYLEAEKLLVSCRIDNTEESEIYAPVGIGHEDNLDTCRNALAAAQVHATLALTAATVEERVVHDAQSVGHEVYVVDAAWREVTQ